jgi:hypothetical protein
LLNQGVFEAGLTKLTVPAITQSIVDEGTIMVYLRNAGTSGGWYPLPYAESGNTLVVNDFGVGFINLKANFTLADAFDFRIVIGHHYIKA